MKRYDLKEILVSSRSTIKEAMKRLDIAASKVIFVIGDDEKFIGSLSDGDIRRGLLSNLSLESSIMDACNKKSYSIQKNFNKEKTINEMKKLDIVFAPVLNGNNEIISIYALPDSHKEVIKKSGMKLDIPVVIMAGGKGTRMAPFTNVLPKPLIPIGEKTILELIIDEFIIYGISDYYFTLNYRGEIIKAYFDSIEKEYNLNYVWEKEFLGTAGCLTLLTDKIKSTFIVSNCDIIVKADIADVYKFHKENNSSLTLISSIQHHTIPYGVVEFGNGGKVSAIKEKPVYSFPINTGVYLLEPECLNYIPENEVFHMTHLIEKLMDMGKVVSTYPVNESEYIDIGQWEEYRRAITQMGIVIQ
jgi:dTDP-glucose pyrophosphorylase